MRKNEVVAPRKYGNRYFDAMECPIEICPETFTVQVNGQTVELPTKECWVPGSFVSRQYAGIKHSLVCLALRSRGFYFKSVSYGPEDGIEIKIDYSY